MTRDSAGFVAEFIEYELFSAGPRFFALKRITRGIANIMGKDADGEGSTRFHVGNKS
jgi:hypothetical protein